MTLRKVTPPQHPAESRRARVEHQVSIEDGVTAVHYFLDFDGAGEATVDVNFPVRFIDRPRGSASFDMPETTVLVTGNLPWASCGAIYRTEEKADHIYYVGAKLLVVMGGTRRQKMTIHWTAEAKAIVGPVTE